MLSLVRQFPVLSAMDRAADGLFARKLDHRGIITWAPALESFARDKELVIRVDIPGVDPQDVQVKVEGPLVTIAGERKPSEASPEEVFAVRGVTYGRFERSVMLPEAINADAVKATYRHGVLEITIPRFPVEHNVAVTFDAALASGSVA